MSWQDKWVKLEELGEGGQGKVFLALSKENTKSTNELAELLFRTIRELGAGVTVPERKTPLFEAFKEIVDQISEQKNAENLVALKFLHSPKDSKNWKSAKERINTEINAMGKIEHPNLLNLIDWDVDGEEKWYASEYFPNSTLADSRNCQRYKGDIPNSLREFRNLVDGVAKLHDQRIIHRDIKPENIFVGKEQELVLGDFGLVFFEDSDKTRLSETVENVGSRDWMPLWATTLRVQDVKPTFDVYSLGKVLWYMVSGLPKLRAHYFNDEDNPDQDLEKLFPDTQFMELLFEILRNSVVEKEKDCLRNANDLLEKIDEALLKIDKGASDLSSDSKRFCRVCGIGEYGLVADRDHSNIQNFGLEPRGTNSFRVFVCNKCGHSDLFFCQRSEPLPEAWNIPAHP